MAKKLSKPQAKIVQFLKKHGQIDQESATKSFDIRAVNALRNASVVIEDTQDGKLIYKLAQVEEAKPAGKKEPKVKKERKVSAAKLPGSDCLCGCGVVTASAKRRFLQGHDARLHSIVLKISRGKLEAKAFQGNEQTAEYLKADAPWMTGSIRKNFDDALAGKLELPAKKAAAPKKAKAVKETPNATA